MIRVVRAVPGSAELAACLKLRFAVFVAEQGVPADQELDALDETALHVLALHGDDAVGTARAVEKAPGMWKIGRVAVAAPWRRRGIGKSLMRGVEAETRGRVFLLDAQTHAIGFYETLGYAAEGPEFLDAGIPHRLMRKAASAR